MDRTTEGPKKLTKDQWPQFHRGVATIWGYWSTLLHMTVQEKYRHRNRSEKVFEVSGKRLEADSLADAATIYAREHLGLEGCRRSDFSHMIPRRDGSMSCYIRDLTVGDQRFEVLELQEARA